jgi:hypothetical protein
VVDLFPSFLLSFPLEYLSNCFGLDPVLIVLGSFNHFEQVLWLKGGSIFLKALNVLVSDNNLGAYGSEGRSLWIREIEFEAVPDHVPGVWYAVPNHPKADSVEEPAVAKPQANRRPPFDMPHHELAAEGF